jgi:hypothetical protein
MSERRRLPNRRGAEIFDFESMGLKLTGCIGRDHHGHILELFVDNHKAGSAIGTLVRDSAIILSFALQHGADIEAIRHALCRDSQGRALGPIAEALDIIARRP